MPESNLPPGVTTSMIPGNTPADEYFHNLCDDLYDHILSLNWDDPVELVESVLYTLQTDERYQRIHALRATYLERWTEIAEKAGATLYRQDLLELEADAHMLAVKTLQLETLNR